ncbi:MAG: histidine kinase, partial [Eubacteriales bacterium]
TKYYINDIIRVQQQTIIMLICSSIIIVLLIIYTANQVTRPIKKLSQAMMEIGQGNLDVSCTVETEDEIGILSQSFNQMVEDMKHLIKSEFEQKVMSQGAEMKSLQMQINPHFLYNTLDTINWMARMQGLDDVGDITSSLGELMRYSLSKNEFVSCKEEIENLRNYVSIQDVRYGDKMSVVFELEEGVGYYYIPKLLIQPILENAIVHGVEEKLEESIITVRIFTKGEELFVIVEDDGVGMDQQAIESLLYDHVQVKQGHTSIGVKNVNRRIKMVFGEECGIQIQSVLGAGTKITLRMKKLKEPIDMVMNYIES